MKITRLIFKNFMGYKNLNLPPNEDQELPDGLIVISGKNSHGKTTILEGILIAFFGPGIITGRSAPDFITYGVQEKTELYVFFTLDNDNYYLHRKWGRKGGSSKRLFKQNKKIHNYNEIKSLDLEDLLEITQKQALSTVFVRQGEVETLANISGANLRDIIIDLFKLNIIDDALKNLQKQKKEFELQVKELRESFVPIDRLEQDIKNINKDIQGEVELCDRYEKEVNNLKAKMKKLPKKENLQKVKEIYEQLNIYDENFESYKKDFAEKLAKSSLKKEDFASKDHIKKKVKEIHNFISQKNEDKAEIAKEKENLNQKIGTARNIIKDFNKKIAKIEQNLKFSDGKAKCPTCQSELTKDHYNKLVSQFQTEIEKNKEINSQLSTELKEKNKTMNSLEVEIEVLTTTKTQIENVIELYNKVIKAKREKDQIIKDLNSFLEDKSLLKSVSEKEILKILEKIAKLDIKIEEANKNMKKSKETIERYEGKIRDLEKEIKEMKKIRKRIGKIDVDIEHIDKTKELVRRFVTEYMVVKRLIKNIKIKADKYIKNFTAGQYSDLSMDVFGKYETGLSVSIKDNYSGVRESTNFISGGDKTALGFALRLAISELMPVIRPTKDSPRKNPKINFLLLDEPLAALDSDRRERILSYLKFSKSFTQIFLITHTTIPEDIKTNKIIVSKNFSTGLSEAKFQQESIDVNLG